MCKQNGPFSSLIWHYFNCSRYSHRQGKKHEKHCVAVLWAQVYAIVNWWAWQLRKVIYHVFTSLSLKRAVPDWNLPPICQWDWVNEGSRCWCRCCPSSRPFVQPHRCAYNDTQVKFLGTHGLCCRFSKGRFPHHSAINDIVQRLNRKVNKN